jgi:hypothetical protein
MAALMTVMTLSQTMRRFCVAMRASFKVPAINPNPAARSSP